jgi:hypothetical protein
MTYQQQDSDIIAERNREAWSLRVNKKVVEQNELAVDAVQTMKIKIWTGGKDHRMTVKVEWITFNNSCAFSTIVRSLCSDSRDLAGLHGPKNFFSFNFDTNWGSKSMKTSLWNADGDWWYLSVWWVVRLFSTLDKKIAYLKVSLLLRITGHAISANAPDRTSISNSFLWI